MGAQASAAQHTDSTRSQDVERSEGKEVRRVLSVESDTACLLQSVFQRARVRHESLDDFDHDKKDDLFASSLDVRAVRRRLQSLAA